MYNQVKMKGGHKIYWSAYTLLIVFLSVAAVAARVSAYQNVPLGIARALDRFDSPGEIIWWVTSGGVFQGYPNTLLGYTILVAANVAIWNIGGILIVYFIRSLKSRFPDATDGR